MHKKKCIAMLLAGGQGSRLGALTSNVAKPAVSFGGKYRIIDFSLSNCINSGIDTVGVLVQYKPLVLNHYVGTGVSWDLDASDGGVHILPPFAQETGGAWYEGTADSIYHNISFIDIYDPEYVLILSGDHIYKMDYSKMLKFHEQNKSDLTVSVIEVPTDEVSRFGIMSTDSDKRITKFAEKPKDPESNMASMGIYIFSWPILKQALLEDHENKNSDHDFGKNIIPHLLDQGKRLFAYAFKGYWKDVGTIESYYESQMDLMDNQKEFNVFSREMKIFSNSNMYPPQFISEHANVENSMVCNGCEIFGRITHSIIGSGVCIGKRSVIEDSILLPRAVIGENCRIVKCIINEDAVIEDNATVISEGGEIKIYGKGNVRFVATE